MTRIVTLKDKKPLVVRPEDVENGPVTICRCGLSAQWPYCDDSHKETRSEADGTLYRYRRDAKDATLERSEEESLEAREADPRPG